MSLSRIDPDENLPHQEPLVAIDGPDIAAIR
jgi:hypothetical protein